jgi:hypothetical protein
MYADALTQFNKLGKVILETSGEDKPTITHEFSSIKEANEFIDDFYKYADEEDAIWTVE